MKIVVSNDHTSLSVKEAVIDCLNSLGHTVIDVGTNDLAAVDFPDMAERGGKLIQDGEAERGVFICGSGVGVCITANKMKGIYACVCHDTYSAHQGVEHDGMNVLCLGGRIIGQELAKELVTAFVNANYQGIEVERFQRRVDKIKNIEKSNKI